MFLHFDGDIPNKHLLFFVTYFKIQTYNSEIQITNKPRFIFLLIKTVRRRWESPTNTQEWWAKEYLYTL